MGDEFQFKQTYRQKIMRMTQYKTICQTLDRIKTNFSFNWRQFFAIEINLSKETYANQSKHLKSWIIKQTAAPVYRGLCCDDLYLNVTLYNASIGAWAVNS